MRTSVVDTFEDNTLLFSSVIEIGDTAIVDLKADIFAIQREIPFFYGHEGSFNYYTAFRVPLLKANIYENPSTSYINDNPIIKVDHIKILGISTSGYVQIGSTKDIYAQARVFDVRHFLHYPVSEDYPLTEIHPSSRGY